MKIAQVGKDGTIYTIVTGKVSRDAKLEYTPNKHTPKVTFSMSYGKKQYVNCCALGENDTTVIASTLEGGDVICAAGTYSERKYTSKKDGSEKVWGEILVDFICPQSSLAFGNQDGVESVQGVPEGSDQAEAQQQKNDDDSGFSEVCDEDEELPF